MKTILRFCSGLLIGIIAGFAIAAVIIVLFTDKTLGQFIHNLISTDGFEILAVVFVSFISFLISVAVLVPIHEAGHLVCGLMTGYKFVSFRIFNLTFIKIDGKIRVKKFSVAGTGGQCLLTPPDLPLDKIPTGWYNAGGVAANILVLLLVLPLFVLNLNPFVVEALAIFCIVDLILILLNGIPMKFGGNSNDGYNLLHLNHDLLAKRAMNLQLRINALIQNGTRPKDMPDEWFEWKTDIDYKNPLEVSIPLMHASRLIDEMDWEKAYEEFNHLYAHKGEITQLYVNEIACELLFLALTTGRTEQAREIHTPDLMKYIEIYSKVMSSKQRILSAIALYLDNDREKAARIYETLKANKEKYLLRGEVDCDLAIMAQMPLSSK